MNIGKVILVGAGPGDPGLITLRALQALRQADVVVYDRLANDELLMYAPPEAERIDVGKTPGSQLMSQEHINKLLVEKAHLGKTVVRLKGGDPFIFGRGGEEALALSEARVPFEVVPGITAAVGASAAAGIPLTHRGLASCVTLITGHEDPTKPASGLDYAALVRTRGTLVFYMGVAQLPQITGNLVAAGMAEDTPAACIEQASTPRQRSVRGTLADIATRAAEVGIAPPAVTVIGAVAALPEALNWFERRPLFGRRIVVTRPEDQARDTADALRELGAEVIVFPTIEVVEPPSWDDLDAALARLDAFDWVVFTSANAVDALMGRLHVMGRDARAFGHARIAVMGPATAAALARHGLVADLVPEHALSTGLVAELDRFGVSGKRLLLPRSSIARAELREGLIALGANVMEAVVYVTRTNTKPDQAILERIRRGEVDLVTFTSASTVRGFVEIVGPEHLAALTNAVRFACIGPVTAAAGREKGIPVALEADEHTGGGLVTAIGRMYEADRR